MINLISVHVPRTAGSSFTWILQQVYKDALYREYGENSTPQYYEPHLIPDKFAAIHGHFPIAKYQGTFPKAKRITWLRHPIDRLVSLFFFLKNSGQMGQFTSDTGIDFHGFIEIEDFHNQITKHVGSDALKNFHFIGIQEFFDDDMAVLSEMLDWPPIEIPHTNITFSSDYPHTINAITKDKALLKTIETYNADDFNLYHAAVKKRAAREKAHVAALYWLSGIRPKTVKAREKALIVSQEKLVAPCGAAIKIPVKVQNTGQVPWEADGSVRLGNHWLGEKKEILLQDDGRATPPSIVVAGDGFEAELEIQVPEQQGTYYVELDMVREKHYWFKEQGSPTLFIKVTATRGKGRELLKRVFRQ